jgi:hypothetical protein
MIMVFNATFKQYFSYIMAVSLIGLRKPEWFSSGTPVSSSNNIPTGKV